MNSLHVTGLVRIAITALVDRSERGASSNTPPLDEKDYKMDVNITSCIDWISCTAHAETNKLDDRVYPSHFQVECDRLERGMIGYNLVRKYTDGRLELMSSERPDMGIHMIYSGDTITCLTRLGYILNGLSLMKFHGNAGHKFTRIDLAIDVYGYGLNVARLAEAFNDKKVVTGTSYGLYYSGLRDTGDTLYVGANSAKKRLRIYDKAKEQGVDGDWKRIELQTRGAMAVGAYKAIKSAKNAATAIAGMIRSYCDFPEDREWSMAVGYKDVQMETPELGETNTEGWITRQVIPGLANYFIRDGNKIGYEEFNELLKDAIVERLGKLQKR